MNTSRKIGFPQILFAPDEGGAPAASAPASGGGGENTSAAPSSPPSGASPSGGSAPAGAPAVAPESSPGGPSPAGAQSSINDFDGLEGVDDTFDGFDEPAPPTEVVAAPPAQPTPPPAAPAAPAPAAAPPPAQQPTPASATGPQEAPPPLPTPAEPARMAEALMQNEPALLDHLAANEFKLSQEDIEALETDAPAYIPKLLARVFLKSQQSALRQMANIVPAMMQKMTEVTKRNTENENKFFSRWPNLKADQHGDTVRRLARTYRQMHPQASLDQMIEDLGPIVMITAKVPLTPAAPNGSGHAPSGSPPPAFRPALSGSVSPPQPTDPNADPWGGLAGSADEE